MPLGDVGKLGGKLDLLDNRSLCLEELCREYPCILGPLGRLGPNGRFDEAELGAFERERCSGRRRNVVAELKEVGEHLQIFDGASVETDGIASERVCGKRGERGSFDSTRSDAQILNPSLEMAFQVGLSA